MHHPGLVTPYDTGNDEGLPYLVMQLVRGTTLQRRVARTVLTPAETCRMGTALASALAHVHARGVGRRHPDDHAGTTCARTIPTRPPDDLRTIP
ncbi:hypothetical protein [Streptomyces sp. NBC_00090]|uniref:hypothetical protein n=1 Tax=Streptomyces sp. NBC_00090 TaxID=2903619 RepID=UPI0038648B13